MQTTKPPSEEALRIVAPNCPYYFKPGENAHGDNNVGCGNCWRNALTLDAHAEQVRLDATCKAFEAIATNLREPGTFRYLIYDRLGFEPKDYEPLYKAGGMEITNAAVEQEERTEKATQQLRTENAGLRQAAIDHSYSLERRFCGRSPEEPCRLGPFKCTACVMTEKQVEQVRTAVVRELAEAVCEYCKGGDAPRRLQIPIGWRHGSTLRHWCRAELIHENRYQREQRERGEQDAERTG